MMEKKRSVGVIVFGIIGIIIGLVVFYLFSNVIRRTFDMVNYQIRLSGFLYSTVGISFIVSGISIFKLKNWGRILFLWLMIVYLLCGLFLVYVLIVLSMAYSDIPGVARSPFLPALIDHCLVDPLMAIQSVVYLAIAISPPISAFIYLTRPKVKEQFR